MASSTTKRKNLKQFWPENRQDGKTVIVTGANAGKLKIDLPTKMCFIKYLSLSGKITGIRYVTLESQL